MEERSLNLKIERFDDIYDWKGGRFRKEFADVLVEHYEDLHKNNEPKRPVGERVKGVFKDAWSYVRGHGGADNDDGPIPLYKVNLMIDEKDRRKIPDDVGAQFAAFCERKKKKYEDKAEFWDKWKDRIAFYGTLGTTYSLVAAGWLHLIEVTLATFTVVGAIPDAVLISGLIPKHLENVNRKKERYFEELEHAPLSLSVYREIA